MPGMFDNITNFYDASTIQVNINDCTDDLATMGFRPQFSTQLQSLFVQCEGARLWIVYY